MQYSSSSSVTVMHRRPFLLQKHKTNVNQIKKMLYLVHFEQRYETHSASEQT